MFASVKSTPPISKKVVKRHASAPGKSKIVMAVGIEISGQDKIGRFGSDKHFGRQLEGLISSRLPIRTGSQSPSFVPRCMASRHKRQKSSTGTDITAHKISFPILVKIARGYCSGTHESTVKQRLKTRRSHKMKRQRGCLVQPDPIRLLSQSDNPNITLGKVSES